MRIHNIITSKCLSHSDIASIEQYPPPSKLGTFMKGMRLAPELLYPSLEALARYGSYL